MERIQACVWPAQTAVTISWFGPARTSISVPSRGAVWIGRQGGERGIKNGYHAHSGANTLDQKTQ